MLKTIHAWAAVAGFCLVGLAMPAVAETLDYKFRTPEDAKDWKVATQKWKVGSKGYTPIIVTPGIIPLTALKDRIFKNVEFSAQIRDTAVESFAGAFIRGTVDGLLFSGYAIYLTNVDGASALIEVIRFDEADLSDDALGWNLCDGFVTYSSKSKITITAKGSKLQAFYNNQLVCSVKDATYSTGSVGFLAREDNVDVIYRRAKIVTPD
jgi:hypothetical protein